MNLELPTLFEIETRKKKIGRNGDVGVPNKKKVLYVLLEKMKVIIQYYKLYFVVVRLLLLINTKIHVYVVLRSHYSLAPARKKY